MGKLLAGVLAILLAACTTSAITNSESDNTQLVISKFPEKVELARYTLGGEQTFALSFIHSVSKTRVTDIYVIRNKEIIQTKELFKAHGAGLPSNILEPGGLAWEKEGENFVFLMNRPIPKLVVRTDKVYQNRLELALGTIDLNQWEDQPLLLYIETKTSP